MSPSWRDSGGVAKSGILALLLLLTSMRRERGDAEWLQVPRGDQGGVHDMHVDVDENVPKLTVAAAENFKGDGGCLCIASKSTT
jgi:hypothetical protein